MGSSDANRIATMLKGIDRYNPENLGELEPHVKQQLANNTYDLPANLAILKLYQFNPSFFQVDIVCGILLKALTSLPSADFSLCECLIDQHHHEDQQIGRLIFLHHLLETCDFKLFWRELSATPELTEGVVGFEDSIKKFICRTVSISYQRIGLEELRSLLGDLGDEELNRWIKVNEWSRLDGDLVFVANQEELVKTRNIVDKVNFEKIQSVMSSGMAT
nr:eukaryotic translation initiation factor 3 subunit K-like [Ciona intestinalis]|eukprot:XP_002131366.1 eukaryotic translation initiation factor 3 subunit K-like [Ciona intestinalis]